MFFIFNENSFWNDNMMITLNWFKRAKKKNPTAVRILFF